MALIFERQFELAAIGLDPAVSDDEVLLDDLGNPEVAERLCGALNCDAGGMASSQDLLLVPTSSITL